MLTPLSTDYESDRYAVCAHSPFNSLNKLSKNYLRSPSLSDLNVDHLILITL